MVNKEKIKVFLVDDDKLFTESLKHALRGDGTDIKTFSTGEECLDNLGKEGPRVVVLDYRLNNDHPAAMNGIQVMNKIKQVSPDTEVIMLSSQNDVTVAVDTMKYGAYDYIDKSNNSFVQIKNDIKHISDFKKQTDDFTKQTVRLKRINIIIVILVILMFIISKIL
jgi:DNA-binding NtrC family response regulator